MGLKEFQHDVYLRYFHVCRQSSSDAFSHWPVALHGEGTPVQIPFASHYYCANISSGNDDVNSAEGVKKKRAPEGARSMLL